MPTYVSPFTGTVVTQTQVTYEYINLDFGIQLYWASTAPTTEYVLARIIDIEPSAVDLFVILPPANQGTRGADSLIRNNGAYDITVYSYNYAQSITVAPGEARYFYLNANTTPEGFWQTFLLGAGTSTADAMFLEGNGLRVVDSVLWTTQDSYDIFNDPTITRESSANVYNWVGGNGSIQLPAVTSLNFGWYFGFRNSGTGSVSLQPQGSTTINDSPNVTFNPGDSGYIIYNNTTQKFFTVGLAAPNITTFTSATYDVDNVSSPLDLTAFAPVIQTYVALSGTRTSNLDIELPPITQIYILVNGTGNSTYDLVFNVAGSSSAPIIVSNGSIATVLSDGTSLFAVSQTVAPGIFIGNDGTAGSPSFTFTNDLSTGLYLNNPGSLGISANAAQIIEVDGVTPIVRVYAPLTAQLINGGTF